MTTLRVGEPHVLAGLLCLVLLAALVGRRLLRRPVSPQRTVALALRTAILTLLAFAIADAEWRAAPDRMQVVFLLDQSLSIPRAQQQLALDTLEAARRTMDPARDQARLVVFGETAVPEGAIEPDHPIRPTASVVGREQTDIQAAIDHAVASFDPGVRRRIVLLSDGAETAGDARAAIARARLGRARIDVVPLDFRYPNDLRLDRIVVPAEAKPGEPVRVRVVVDALEPARARVHLERDGARVETRAVDLHAGTNVVVFDLVPPRAGFVRLHASVEADDREQDAIFQNDAASGFVFVRGTESILYVHREDGPSRALLDALAAERIAITRATPESVPSSAASLQAHDAIVLDDVPRAAFTDAQLAAIERSVSDDGTGLVMIGGESSFGAGGWTDTVVAKALPVECEPRQTTVTPSLALVLCMDKSGSMGEQTADGRTKIELARKGAALTARRLSRGDSLGVLGFDGSHRWVVPLARLQDPAAVDGPLGALQADGGTNLHPALVESIDALARSDASVKHVIVLTDGRSEAGDWQEAVARARRAKVTVSTISVGADVDDRLLLYLAAEGGGKCYFVKRAADLPAIFLRETQRVSRPLIVNATFTPRRSRPSEVLVPGDALPQLLGFIATEAKERAEVPLVGPKGEPILAHWHHGAGKVLAFTSDASRWGASWVRWSGFQTFWARAIRWTSKDVVDATLQVTTRIERGHAKVVVDAIDEQGRTREALTVEGEVSSPGGERRHVVLSQVAPGRYEADFPATETGAHLVSLSSRESGRARRHTLTTGLVVPYAEEYRRPSSDRVKLEAIAREGQGAVVEPSVVLHGPRSGGWDGFFSRAGVLAAEESVSGLAPVLLAAAALLFLLDVLVRKLALHRAVRAETSKPEGPRALASGPSRPAPATGPASGTAADHTRRLLEAKRRAQRGPGAPPPPPERT